MKMLITETQYNNGVKFIQFNRLFHTQPIYSILMVHSNTMKYIQYNTLNFLKIVYQNIKKTLQLK